MTHTEALNLILANSCPSHVDADTEVATFFIQTHCTDFEVCAKLSSITPEGGIQYNIISVEAI